MHTPAASIRLFRARWAHFGFTPYMALWLGECLCAPFTSVQFSTNILYSGKPTKHEWALTFTSLVYHFHEAFSGIGTPPLVHQSVAMMMEPSASGRAAYHQSS